MENNLRSLQLEETKMLGTLIDFFNENSIRFFVLAGTFLGTIRHKGFVPWDDDIDVGVPREDYERLISLVQSTKKIGSMEVRYFKNDYSLLHYPLRVVNPNIILTKKLGTEVVEAEAWITLFPLDGMPKNAVARYIRGRILLLRRFNYVMARYLKIVDSNAQRYSKLKKTMVKLAGTLGVYKLFDEVKTVDRMDADLKKYPYDKSDYIMTLMGGYKLKEMFPKEVFGEGKKYPFEDIEVIGPIDYERYLTQIYGDWRTPPPENDPERNHHRLIGISIKENNSNEE